MSKAQDIVDRIKETRPTKLLSLVQGLTKLSGIEKRIDVQTVSGGVVALVRGDDGNAYEVTIKPAVHGTHKNLFKKYLQK